MNDLSHSIHTIMYWMFWGVQYIQWCRLFNTITHNAIRRYSPLPLPIHQSPAHYSILWMQLFIFSAQSIRDTWFELFNTLDNVNALTESGYSIHWIPQRIVIQLPPSPIPLPLLNTLNVIIHSAQTIRNTRFKLFNTSSNVSYAIHWMTHVMQYLE